MEIEYTLRKFMKERKFRGLRIGVKGKYRWKEVR